MLSGQDKAEYIQHNSEWRSSRPSPKTFCYSYLHSYSLFSYMSIINLNVKNRLSDMYSLYNLYWIIPWTVLQVWSNSSIRTTWTLSKLPELSVTASIWRDVRNSWIPEFTPALNGVRIARCLVFCVVFCTFLFWPLYCPSYYRFGIKHFFLCTFPTGSLVTGIFLLS
jgi:hypothetical protein